MFALHRLMGACSYAVGFHSRPEPINCAVQTVLPFGIITSLIKGECASTGDRSMTRPARRPPPPLFIYCGSLMDSTVAGSPARRYPRVAFMADVTLRKVVQALRRVRLCAAIDLDLSAMIFVGWSDPRLRKSTSCELSRDWRCHRTVTSFGGDGRQLRPPNDRDIAMVFQNYALYPP